MINKQAIEIKSVFNLVYYANDVLQNFEVDIASVMTKGHVDNSKVLWLALNNHEPGTAVKRLCCINIQKLSFPQAIQI